MTAKDEYTAPKNLAPEFVQLMADKRYEELINRLNPDIYEELFWRAEAYWQINQYQLAFKDFITLTHKNSLLPDVVRRLCQFLMDFQEIEKAKIIAIAHLTNFPLDTQILLILGIAHNYLGEFSQALQCFARVLAIKPYHIGAKFNQYIVSDAMADYRSSEAQLANYIHHNPIDCNAQYAYATYNIRMGNFQRGFLQYDYRLMQMNHDKLSYNNYWLNGINAKDKRILVVGEQGLGDEIQFSRFVMDLCQSDCQSVIFMVKPNLFSLFQSSFTHPKLTIIDNQSPIPIFDYWLYVMSLPARLGITRIPNRQYLAVHADKIAKFHNLLGKKHKLRIGICWTGSGRNNHAYLPLGDKQTIHMDFCKNLFADENCEFVSLQLTMKPDEREQYPHIRDFSDDINDFSDTAALAMNMDRVVVIDSSVCHLVGGLGIKGWLLLPKPHCWRWGHQESPINWYDGLKILRSLEITGKNGRGWNQVMEDLHAEIRQLY